MEASMPPRDTQMENTLEHGEHRKSPAQENSSSMPPVDTMTSRFGMMLLERMQESHERMNTLVATFITQQNEAHERLWYLNSHRLILHSTDCHW